MRQGSVRKELNIDDCRKCQVDILRLLDQICRENGIEYSLAYGTLLGAVRHKGFIPWDDDVDIMLLRKDYEMLISIISSNNAFPYILLSHNNAFFPWTKVCDPKTEIEEFSKAIIDNYGVWVDIFPIDEMPDYRKRESKTFRLKLDLLYSFSKLRITRFRDLNIKKRLLKLLIQFFPRFYFANKWDKYVQKYNGKDTGYLGFPFAYGIEKQTFTKDMFAEYTDVEFEGEKYRCIRQKNEFLEIVYGNYMELPPKEEQVYKHSYKAYWKL